MTQYILAQLHHMAQSELDEMLEAGTIERLKAAGDPAPMIKVFSIGHEGTARPSMVTSQGKVRVTLQYLRDAVNLIAQRVGKGVIAFKDHAATNLHAGRKTVGQVVAKTVKEIDGKLHALTAIHIFPEHRDEDLDIASFEANAKFGTDKDNNAKLWDLENITGIALGSSKEGKTPAFPGATLRGAFQHFAESTTLLEEKTMTTLKEVQDAVSAGQFTPTAVFGENALLAAEPVQQALDAAKKNQQDHFERNRRLLDDAQDRQKELQEQLTEKDKVIDESNASALKQKDGVKFEKIATDRKLGEKEKAFCAYRLKDFASEAKDEAGREQALNKFTDEMLQEHEKMSVEVFGIEKKDPTKAGAPPNSNSPKGDGTDMSDPANNDFIPQGER